MVGQIPLGVKKTGGVANVGFWLLHSGHIEEDEALAQMLICAETTDGSGGNADDTGRFGLPGAFAVRTRADINGVLEAAGDGTVVLRSEKQSGVTSADLLAKRNPRRGRIVGFEILVVERENTDLDEFEIKGSGFQRNDGVCELTGERVLAKTSNENGNR